MIFLCIYCGADSDRLDGLSADFASCLFGNMTFGKRRLEN
jgi:hypothetical protein